MGMQTRVLVASVFIAACYLFVTTTGARLPICYFLMRDFNGFFVEVMRKCPAGTSYCAARVSNATGVRSLVVDYYEYYCENERNITRNLNIGHAPSQGCYVFGAEPDEFVCFCEDDFCNHRDKIEQLFLNIHNSNKRPLLIHHAISQHPTSAAAAPASTTAHPPSTDSFLTTLSFGEELRKFRSPLLTDQTWRRRDRRETHRSFEQKVVSNQFIMTENPYLFLRKKPAHVDS